MRALAGPALVAGAVILVFFPAAGYQLLQWDDFRLIGQTIELFQRGGWAALFFGSGGEIHYKPVAQLTFLANWATTGAAPAPYHWVNILLHALNAALLSSLLASVAARWKKWPPRKAAQLGAAAALVWALHPLRAEAVAWVSARPHELGLCFSLVSACLFLRAREEKKGAGWLALSAAAYGVGLLSYPSCFLLPLIFFGGDRAAKGRRLPWKRWLFFAVPAALVVALELLQRHAATQAGRVLTAPFGQQALSTFYLCASALAKHAWPFSLSPVYVELADPGRAARLGALSAAALLALTGLLFRRRRQLPELWFGWLAFFALLAPTLADRPEVLMAHDRYTYAAGTALWAALLFAASRARHAQAPLGIAALLCLPAAALTRAQLPVWRDSESVYRRMLSTVGEDPFRHRLELELAFHLSGAGRHEEAVREIRLHAAALPGDPRAQAALALVLLRAGRSTEARAAAERALSLDPRLPEALDVSRQLGPP